MRIRRLKLSGFKSFVEPTELRIEAGLTGVVGPNGCGKSNLLEAIRWVMGEGSPKSLRGDGMEDVIFAGTATRPPRDFAEVSMQIDRDTDDDEGVVDGEVTRQTLQYTGSFFDLLTNGHGFALLTGVLTATVFLAHGAIFLSL